MKKQIMVMMIIAFLGLGFNVQAMDSFSENAFREYQEWRELNRERNEDLGVGLMDTSEVGDLAWERDEALGTKSMDTSEIGNLAEVPDVILIDMLENAASAGDIAKVQEILKQGINVNGSRKGYGGGYTALIRAAQNGHDRMCNFLIENGAEINLTAHGGYTALTMAALPSGTLQVMQVLLTAIPFSEREKILNTKAAIIAAHLSFKKTKPILPKDIRKLITQPLIDALVDEHMEVIAKLLNVRTEGGATVRDAALQARKYDIVQLIDLNNPESVAKIRHQVAANIRKILAAPVNQQPPVVIESEIRLIEFQGEKKPLLSWVMESRADSEHPFLITSVISLVGDTFTLKGDISSINEEDIQAIRNNNYVYCPSYRQISLSTGGYAKLGAIIIGTKDQIRACYNLEMGTLLGKLKTRKK